jgi:hypothetical protein
MHAQQQKLVPNEMADIKMWQCKCLMKVMKIPEIRNVMIDWLTDWLALTN